MTHWHTPEALQDIRADLPRFEAALQTLAGRLALDINGLHADHISLRCHQNATAERWRKGFEQCGTLLSENIINGRPICLFRLDEPVCVGPWRFTVVEVDYPHGSHIVAEGDLAGDGRWTLRQDGPDTAVTYEWNVAANHPFIRRFSWLLRPLFAANHDWTMRQGLTGLRHALAERAN